MRTENLIKLFSVAAIATTLVATSCTDFDFDNVPKSASQEFAENFIKTYGEIAADQDWNTLATVEASITANLNYGSEYKVAVYLENPLFTTEEPRQVAFQRGVQEGETVNFVLDVPSYLTTLYVAFYDSQNHLEVFSVDIDEETGALTLDAGGETTLPTRAAAWSSAQYSQYGKSLEGITALRPAQMRQYYVINNDQIQNHLLDGRTLTNARTVYGTKGWKLNESTQTWEFIENGPEDNYLQFFDSWEADGFHYFVPSGTTVDVPFFISPYPDATAYDKVVLYIEGTVVVQGNSNNTFDDVTIYVGKGGVLDIRGDQSLSNYARIIVEEGGKVIGNSGVTLAVANGSECYNAGTINFAGTLNVNGSQFYNAASGVINVDILTNTATFAEQNNIVNFGKITARTNNLDHDNWNCPIINACYLHFTQDAGVGQLTLLDNSRLDVDGQARMCGENYLNNQSEINVGSLYLTNGSFNGPTGSGKFAILKTGSIWVGQGYDCTFNNNVYVDWNKDEIYDKNGTKLVLENEWSVKTTLVERIEHWINQETAPASFTIEPSECTGNGYVPSGDPEPDPEVDPAAYIIAFEDLGNTDDSDFNDVVISVAHTAGSTKTYVQLLAAGGTRETYIMYNGTKLWSGAEVHALFGVEQTTMVNTGWGTPNTTPSIYEFDVPSDWTIKAKASLFAIEVHQSDGVYTTVNIPATAGIVPQAILVADAKWAWPSERQNIGDRYPGFYTWVSGNLKAHWYDEAYGQSSSSSNGTSGRVINNAANNTSTSNNSSTGTSVSEGGTLPIGSTVTLTGRDSNVTKWGVDYPAKSYNYTIPSNVASATLTIELSSGESVCIFALDGTTEVKSNSWSTSHSITLSASELAQIKSGFIVTAYTATVTNLKIALK